MRLIKNCINKQLVSLCQRSVQLEELHNKISQLLPCELAKGCQVSNFDKGCLTITTTDASWASQLRYLVFELRDKLRTGGLPQLLAIKINLVEPLIHYEKHHSRIKPSLSAKAKVTIIQESRQCNYPPLRQALLNLADKKEVIS
jgi:hypothetical protein